MTILTRFGKFLQTKRKQKRLSLNSLSKKVYGSPAHTGYLSNIEKGKQDIKLTTMSKILLALDLDLRDVFM